MFCQFKSRQVHLETRLYSQAHCPASSGSFHQKRQEDVCGYRWHDFLWWHNTRFILPTSQRPDLFLYNEKAKKAIIAELTVPFEPNIPNAHEIKQSKYAGLLSDLNRAGVNTSLVCFEIGSRGLITQDNVARIRSILKFKKQISRDISKLALLGSYAIWNSRKEATRDNISCLKINGALLSSFGFAFVVFLMYLVFLMYFWCSPCVGHCFCFH